MMLLSPIIKKRRKNGDLFMNGREKNSDLVRYLRALINPQSATDWQMVAWDKRSPYNQHLTEMLLDNSMLEDIIEKIIVDREIMLAKNEAEHDEYLEKIYDEDATRLIRGQLFNAAPTPRPAPTGKDYSLDAAINILEKELNVLREEIPGLEERITTNHAKLRDLDSSWQDSRKEDADKYGVSLEAKKDALTALGLPADMDAINEVKKALLIPSPATILKVNPGLVSNTDIDPSTLAQNAGVVRDLSCVIAFQQLVHAATGMDTPQSNILPSLAKQLCKAHLLPGALPVSAANNFIETLSITRDVNNDESRLSYIRDKEKLFGVLKNNQFAKQQVAEVKGDEEHKPATPHP